MVSRNCYVNLREEESMCRYEFYAENLNIYSTFHPYAFTDIICSLIHPITKGAQAEPVKPPQNGQTAMCVLVNKKPALNRNSQQR